MASTSSNAPNKPPGSSDPPKPARAWVAVALSVTAGLLYFAAFPGVGLWPLAFVALVPLLIATQHQRPRTALGLALLSGTTTAMFGFWWILGMLTRYSGFPAVVCFFFLLILSIWQGGRLALAVWMYRKAELNRWPGALAFISCFAGTEAIYPLLFPWYFGCALEPAALLIQTADLGGPILLSSTLAVVNLAVHHAVSALREKRRPNFIWLGAAAMLLIATIGYGLLRIHQVEGSIQRAAPLTVGLVQGDIPMEIQGQAAYRDAFQRQAQASAALVQQRANLVIWSESSFLYQVPEADADRFVGEAFSRQLGASSIVGAVLFREAPGHTTMTNSALVMDRDGRLVGRYDKHHLLAFGEYIPFGEALPFLYDWSPESGHFTAGQGFEPISIDHHAVGLLICYEDILPGFVNAAVRSTRPELLINVTNDAWFGETAEPELHLALSQLRAVEHRRFLVRSANTGVSAIIDPAGRVIARSPMFAPATLFGTVRWMTGATAYEIWGDAPWYTLFAVGVMMTFWKRRGHRTRSANLSLPTDVTP